MSNKQNNTPNSLDQKNTDVVSGTSEKDSKKIDKVASENIKLDGVRPPENGDIKNSSLLNPDITVLESNLKDKAYLKTNLSQMMLDLPLVVAPEGKDLGVLKNSYAETLVNAVVASGDKEILNIYLNGIGNSNLTIFGSDKPSQVKNYNTLVNSEFCKSTITKEQQTALLSVKLAIENIPQLPFKEAMKQSFDEVIKQFGAVLLSIFEVFGGKGALRGFCDTFKIDYNKHFASIEKLYHDVYVLDDSQTDALKTIYAGSETFVPQDASQKCDESAVNTYYQTWGTNNFALLDPVLVNRAMKQMNLPTTDVIVEDGTSYGEMQYKINTIPPQKDAIVAQILKDPSLWSSVNALNDPDIASTIYGKNNTEAGSNWASRKPSDPKSIAVAFGACLMKGSKDLKYVISQNDMPYKKDNDTKLKATAVVTAVVETPEITKIKTEWTTFFTTVEGNDRKEYPLSDDKVTKLTSDGKTKYDAYKKTISEKISTLLDPNKKDLSGSLLSDASLKEKITPFLTKHFSVYLNDLSKNTTLTEANKKDITVVINKFKTMTPGFSVELSASGLSIKGKDGSTPSQDVEIKTSDFTWLPKLASSVAVAPKTPVKAKGKK